MFVTCHEGNIGHLEEKLTNTNFDHKINKVLIKGGKIWCITKRSTIE